MSHPYTVPVPPVGGLCRCAPCCCKRGKGHNDPRWIAYEEALDALEDELRESAARVDPPS